MTGVEVQWKMQRLQQGAPLECWRARLVKPFVSRDFAWLVRQDGMWLVHIMLRDVKIRRRASYACQRPDLPMRHTERWIAAAGRWEKLLVADGAEDPRGKFSRFEPTSEKYHGAVRLWEFGWYVPRSSAVPAPAGGGARTRGAMPVSDNPGRQRHRNSPKGR
jgi:hypothetical protein